MSLKYSRVFIKGKTEGNFISCDADGGYGEWKIIGAVQNVDGMYHKKLLDTLIIIPESHKYFNYDIVSDTRIVPRTFWNLINDTIINYLSPLKFTKK